MFFDKTRIFVLLLGVIVLIGIASCGGAGGSSESSELGSDLSNISDVKVSEIAYGEVVSGYCTKDKDCNDNIDCTADACLSGNCSYMPDNTKCDKGQICDGAKGGCVKAKSCFSKEDCNDYLECTVEGCDSDTNTCQYIYDDSRCPDGYICFLPPDYFNSENEGDEISGCAPTKRCKVDKDCVPEETSCAVGKCLVDVCVYSADYDFCNDGNMCNGSEICSSAGNLDSSDACAVYGGWRSFPDYCSHYNCIYAAEDCYDNTDCTGFIKRLSCDDGNHCTNASCDPQNGCVFTNNNKSCEDGEICTKNDQCSDGVCVGGPSVDCDDKNPCTADYCKSGASPCQYDKEYDAMICNVQGDTSGSGPGCNHKIDPVMEDESCDMPCVKDGICSSGDCTGGSPVDCDDKNPCTNDSCNSKSGCTNEVVVECGPSETCCGESCCSSGQVCYEDFCCTPEGCANKECGNDGCGKSCGECQQGSICDNGKCLCNPILKSSYDIWSGFYDIFVLGNLAFVANSESGLQIIDVSNPASPTLKGNYDTGGYTGDIFVLGNLAYVANGYSLQIIDVSNPASPTVKGGYTTNTDAQIASAQGVFVLGNLAYVVGAFYGLQVIDVSNPAFPILKGMYKDIGGDGWNIFVLGNLAFVADGWGYSLQVIDVSNPASPVLKGSYDTVDQTWSVFVLGNFAYLANSESGLQIIDVSSPASPTLKGSYDTVGDARGIFVLENLAYVADGYSLQVIDVSNPASTVLKGSYDMGGAVGGIFVLGNLAYVADSESGLWIIDVSSCQ